jgi:acetoacetate decarboxylase
LADALKTAFAMPLTSPSYLVTTYRTGRAGIEAVPEPLTCDEPLVCSEFIRLGSSADFSHYLGAAQYIPVKLNGKSGRLGPTTCI